MFYLLRLDEVIIHVSYHTETFRARVEHVRDDRAILFVPDFEAGPIRRCRIKFEIINQLFQFEVLILEIAEDMVTIKIPAFIQSAQRRKNPRIHVDDLFLRMNILYRPLFGTRGIGQVAETRFPSFISELKNDEPDLHLINRIITEEILKITPNYSFKLYGDSKDLNLMERTVKDGKTVFIQDISRTENYFERQSFFGMTNYHKEFNRLLLHQPQEEVQKVFESMRQEDSRNYIRNYVCIPLEIFNSVVGHVFLYSSVLGKKQISFEQAQLIDLLVQMLNYAMSKTAIARTYFKHTLIRVVNVSLGGCLFEMNNEVLFDYLTFHDRLKILLQIRYHILDLHAEVSRYYPTEKGYHLGVRFLKAGPDDYRALEEYIYNRNKLTFR